MKFNVIVLVTGTVTVEVEADNPEQAREKVWDNYEAPCLCHQCARTVEMDDGAEIFKIEAVE